jgi:hypothetical protein
VWLFDTTLLPYDLKPNDALLNFGFRVYPTKTMFQPPSACYGTRSRKKSIACATNFGGASASSQHFLGFRPMRGFWSLTCMRPKIFLVSMSCAVGFSLLKEKGL